MAVDTATKRLSMLGFGGDSILLPSPDGDFSAGDRLSLLGLYGGINALYPQGFLTCDMILKSDMVIDTSFSPWRTIYYKQGTTAILMEKEMRDYLGDGVTDVATSVASMKKP